MKKKNFDAIAPQPVTARGIIADHTSPQTPAKATKPPIPEAERLSKKLTLYLTPGEWEIIRSKAGREKVATHLRGVLQDSGYFDE